MTVHRWLGLVALVLVALAWGPLLGAGLVDDAYIFARYAENLLAGHGAVFNPGERVEGYTSPAHLALVTALTACGLDAPLAAQTAGLLALIGLVALLGLSGRGGLTAAAMVALFAPFSLWAWAGMDAPLFALAVAGAALALRRALRDGGAPGVGTWLLVGATVLVRPEGLAAAAGAWVAAAPRMRQRGGFAPLLPLVALLPFVALTVVRLAYYDSWLPNTFYAKVDQGGPALWVRGASYLVDAALAAAPLVGAVLLGVLRLERWPGPAAWMAMALAGAVVITGGDHFPMFRFALPIVALLAIVAWPTLLEASRPRVAAAVVAGALAFTSWLAPAPLTGGDKDMIHRFQDEVAMASLWEHVGRSLRAALGSDRSAAMIVVGAIPYATGWQTIDMLGLTDRHIAHAATPRGGYAGHEKFDSDYVLERAPDLIVLLPTVWQEPVPEDRVLGLVWGAANQDLAASPAFRAAYTLIWVPTDGGVIPVHQRSAGPKGPPQP